MGCNTNLLFSQIMQPMSFNVFFFPKLVWIHMDCISFLESHLNSRIHSNETSQAQVNFHWHNRGGLMWWIETNSADKAALASLIYQSRHSATLTCSTPNLKALYLGVPAERRQPKAGGLSLFKRLVLLVGRQLCVHTDVAAHAVLYSHMRRSQHDLPSPTKRVFDLVTPAQQTLCNLICLRCHQSWH